LTLLGAAVIGYYFTVPLLEATGAILENEMAWKILGGLISSAVTFLMLAVVIGPILVLFDIRRSVRAIETKSSDSGSKGRGLPVEIREPFLL
ncbi:MAG: hypothetical protein PVI98_04260, partial [Burkholderiales bacterium]